ncbi:MAG: phenylacetate--CoA ligase family protein, partial [Clostridiales bacterium]|nr:phenylacetate--CoA ligase family protein [Clostridiales bacterium]
VKVKGVNIFPSQIEEMLSAIEGASSEYQFMIDHLCGKDICTLFVEANPGVNHYELETEITQAFKYKIGVLVITKPVEIGELPRSEKKSTRVFDNRY